jgi:hypothetical protein
VLCSIWIELRISSAFKDRRLKCVVSLIQAGSSITFHTPQLIARIRKGAHRQRPFNWVTLCGTVKSLRRAKLNTPVSRGGAISVIIFTEHSKVFKQSIDSMKD